MKTMHTAYLALGANLGDRAANIHAALDGLCAFATVKETAFLYETPPAYVLDQPPFLNTVCQIRTHLSPLELLQSLKALEAQLGRAKTVRYGPRMIDLDILLYDELVMQQEALTIPHPRLPERDFVLQPLCDLAATVRHPVLGLTIRSLWEALNAPSLPRVTPVGKQLWTWGAKTYIMGIINATPDSFSGDGLFGAERQGEQALAPAVAQARRFAAEGADLLDVGGYSTRPGHADLPVEEEIRRVTPVIAALRDAVDLPISIDTFRTPVAEAALDAGAHWINDVWGLRLFPDLADLAAHRHASLVMMHNRSQPLEPYRHRLPNTRGAEYGDLIGEIRDELTASVAIARRAGVARWNQVIDPGMGFGKSLDHHLELIDRLGEIRVDELPILFGSSRKGFIGRLLGDVKPNERLNGVIATNVLAIDRGADIVRVHDVQAIAQAARVADAIARRRGSPTRK